MDEKTSCYGLLWNCVGRLLACLAEEYNDESGLKLPITSSPFQVHLVSLIKETDVVDKIYADLEKANIDVLYDDRKESAGVKFADADLIGVPIRITIGSRTLKENSVEIKLRRALDESQLVPIDKAVAKVGELITTLVAEIENSIVVKEL